MALLDQRNSERAGSEFRIYAGFLPNSDDLKEVPPKGGTPNEERAGLEYRVYAAFLPGRQAMKQKSRLRRSRRKAGLQTENEQVWSTAFTRPFFLMVRQ